MPDQTGSPITPELLFRHNMANLKVQYPQLHQLLSRKKYQSTYKIQLQERSNTLNCIVQPRHSSAPERGKNGFIHADDPNAEAGRNIDSSGWENHEITFVINTGLGYTARYLGERFFVKSFAANLQNKLIFVEEDFDLFRLSLHLQYWDVDFWSPQVMWIVGTPLSQLHRHPFFSEFPNLFINDPLFLPGGILSQRERKEMQKLQQHFRIQKSKAKAQIYSLFNTLQNRQYDWKPAAKPIDMMTEARVSCGRNNPAVPIPLLKRFEYGFLQVQMLIAA